MTYSKEAAIKMMVQMSANHNAGENNADVDLYAYISENSCVVTHEPLDAFVCTEGSGINNFKTHPVIFELDGIKLYERRDFQSKKGARRSDLYAADFGDFRIVSHNSY